MGAPIARFKREQVSLPPEALAYGPPGSGPTKGTPSFFVIFFLSFFLFFSFVNHFKSQVLENRTFFKIKNLKIVQTTKNFISKNVQNKNCLNLKSSNLKNSNLKMFKLKKSSN
jgi:hypothetical protein